MNCEKSKFPINEVIHTIEILSDVDKIITSWYCPGPNQSSPSDDFTFLFDSSFIDWKCFAPNLFVSEIFKKWETKITNTKDPEIGEKIDDAKMKNIQYIAKLSKIILSKLKAELNL